MAAWAELVVPSVASATMWWRCMRDDIPSLRGQGGSPSDPGGVVGPQGSAPAPDELRARLIAVIERELCRIKADNSEASSFTTKAAIDRIIAAGKNWLDAHPGFQRRGRLSLEHKDYQLLLDLRAANPGSDCREAFCQAIGPHLTPQQHLFRYNRAARRAAEEDKSTILLD